MTKITSHILDTSKGQPAEGVTIILFEGSRDQWTELARATTNSDGRAPGLTDGVKALQPQIYKLRFETKDYFDKGQIKTFYPYVEIIFEVTASEHYHVPLLINPYGYSTYRGS